MKFQKSFIWAALILSVVIGAFQGSFAVSAALIVLTALVNAGFHRSSYSGLCRVTLSVPELSQLIMDAFKKQTPEVFKTGGFAMDLSSKTAVLGDKITAHIGAIPAAAAYDSVTGFANGVTDATSLLTDVPVTLNQFMHVPIRIKWLSQLSSKLDLTRAIVNQGYTLRKLIIDTALQQVLSTNFTHQYAVDPANVNLDTLEALRTKLSGQAASPMERFGIVNSIFAGALQADQRVGSSLFYNMLNGGNAYRKYTNIAGFQNVYEYPDMFTGGNLAAYFGDRRGITIAVRAIDYSNAADLLRVPKVMETFPMIDEESGFPFTGVAWQAVGTGDVFYTVGVLFGVSAGDQGGATDSITGQAGVRVVTSGSNA